MATRKKTPAGLPEIDSKALERIKQGMAATLGPLYERMTGQAISSNAESVKHEITFHDPKRCKDGDFVPVLILEVRRFYKP